MFEVIIAEIYFKNCQIMISILIGSNASAIPTLSDKLSLQFCSPLVKSLISVIVLLPWFSDCNGTDCICVGIICL